MVLHWKLVSASVSIPAGRAHPFFFLSMCERLSLDSRNPPALESERPAGEPLTERGERTRARGARGSGAGARALPARSRCAWWVR
jgi:hypothetical protein